MENLNFTVDTPIASTVHHPFGSPSGPGLWHMKGKQLPAYIQNVAHALLRSGSASTESDAIHKAVGIVKDWAAGHATHGKRVTPDVQAAAQRAIAEWYKLRGDRATRTAAKTLSNNLEHVFELANPHHNDKGKFSNPSAKMRERIIKAFQKTQGLEITGELDKPTNDLINDLKSAVNGNIK